MTQMTRFRRIAVLFFLLIPALLGARGNDDMTMEAKGPISVGSKIDTEGALLGNMILLLLEENGFETVDRTELGPTDVVRGALENGEIDMYVEYTGNGKWFFDGDNTYGDDWKIPAKALAAVRELDGEAFGVRWLQPAPANNTWAIAVRGDVARANGLVTLSDFGAFVAGGGDIKLAGSEEFVSRPDSLPAFEEAYGFHLENDQLLVLSGGNTATTEQAAARGTDGVNAAMAYGTDGQLAALGLVVMEDDKNVQLVYEPAPRVRGDVLDRYPELADILEPVFLELDLVTLQTLNAQIAVEGQPARSVAWNWLLANGHIED